MKKKNAARVATSEADPLLLGALAKPQVAAPSTAALAAAVAALGPDNAADVSAKTTETTGSSTETTVEKDEESDEAGTTSTTTTTTTDTEYSGSEDDSEEESDGDSEEESDGEEEKDAATAAAITTPPARLTSGDVLKLVRDVTGCNTPAEQIVALRTIADNSKRTAKAEKGAAKSKHAVRVDALVRSGCIASGKRAEALKMTSAELSAVERLAVPMVRSTSSPRTAVRDPKTAATPTSSTPAAPSSEAHTIARAMGMDPVALEAANRARLSPNSIH